MNSTIPVTIAPAAVPLGLLALMIATRFGHFGSALSLPDATLGVLFLLGTLGPSALWLAAALATAVVVDVLVIRGGVSSYCLTPAYPALLIAYGLMWLAGRALRSRAAPGSAGRVLIGLGLCAIAAAVSEVVSSGSFYLWSGYFGAMSASAYAAAVRPFVALMIISPVAYAALGLMTEYLFARHQHALSRRGV